MKKHFIDLNNFTLNELRIILNIAKDIKLNPSQFTERLKQKSLGMLFENGPHGREFIAYTIEDEFREEKVSGETRIPEGTYDIKLRKTGGFNSRYATKFGEPWHKGMLHVQDVPGFEYILIHTGNTDEDTMGCLLVADTSQQNITKGGFIGASVDAYKRIYPELAQWLEDGNKLSITYIDYDNPRN